MSDIRKPTTYDDIPYRSGPFFQTHPDRLTTIGRLFGMTPADITCCRVLELGCARGGNLIPMAYHLPDSEFIGIDASRRQIKTGQAVIANLQLDNIRLEKKNILDVDHNIGIFDYIIAHGVYSWVGDDVQEKIFSIAEKHLSPQGIAYVSYNTYPGWHMREMIRNMMLYHIQPFDTAQEKIEQARALMDFLTSSVPTAGNHYGMLLKEEFDLIQRVRDWYLFHDHLEEINTPIYFHEFMERASRHGLQYLGESDFSTMLLDGFSSETTAALKRVGSDIIKTEQYMDFLRNRHFRQTLLCHQAVNLKRDLSAKNVSSFSIASSARPECEAPNLLPGVKLSFVTISGSTVTTPSPITKAAHCVLHQHWPLAMDAAQLFREANSMLSKSHVLTGLSDEASQEELFKDLIHLFAKNIVEFHTWQAQMTNTISNCPKISLLAAVMADASAATVNQRHETIVFDTVSHHLLNRLDGTRNKEQLFADLLSLVSSGGLVIKENDKPLNDPQKIKDAMHRALEQSLQFLCNAAMLVG